MLVITASQQAGAADLSVAICCYMGTLCLKISSRNSLLSTWRRFLHKPANERCV